MILGIGLGLVGTNLYAQMERYYSFLSWDPELNQYSYNGQISPFELGDNYHKVFLNDRLIPLRGYYFANQIRLYGAHFLSNQKLRKVERFNREGNLELIQYYSPDGKKIRDEYLDKPISIENRKTTGYGNSLDYVSIFTYGNEMIVLDRRQLTSSTRRVDRFYGREVNFYNIHGQLVKQKIYDNMRNLLFSYVHRYVGGKRIRTDVYRTYDIYYYSLAYYQHETKVGEDFFHPDGTLFLKERYSQNQLVSTQTFDKTGSELSKQTRGEAGPLTGTFYLLNENNEWTKRWDIVFNEQGTIKEELCKNRHLQTLIRTHVSYTPDERIASFSYEGRAGRGTVNYQYASDGMVIDATVTGTPHRGRIQFNEAHTHQTFTDASGHIRYEVLLDDEGELLIRHYRYEQGRIQEVQLYNKQGTSQGKELYIYEAGSNLKAINHYDRQQRIVLSERFLDGHRYEIHFDKSEIPVFYKGFEHPHGQLSFIDYLDDQGRIYQHVAYDPTGKMEQRYVAQFDRFDRKTEAQFYNHQDERIKSITYNRRGLPAVLTHFTDSGRPGNQIKYTYWQDSETVQEAHVYDPQGRMREQYQYNTNGERTQQIIYRTDETIEWIHRYHQGTLTERYFYEYEQGRIRFIDRYNAANQPLGSTEYIYDNKGTKIGEQHYDRNGQPL